MSDRGRIHFPPSEVTAEQVRAYRDETGSGLMEAKDTLRRREFLERMRKFEETASVEDKVDFILDWITTQDGPRV